MLISRNPRITVGSVDQRLATSSKFLHECQCSCGIISGNPVADFLEIGFCGGGDNDDHRPLAASLRYLDSSRSNALDSGFTRPASASAIPRAMAVSSAANLDSRS